jgi:hypothetical protein
MAWVASHTTLAPEFYETFPHLADLGFSPRWVAPDQGGRTVKRGPELRTLDRFGMGFGG